MGPLTGVRVLDLSRLLPGPACTWLLQGLGASVDRVEPPGRGDFSRHVPPFIDGVGAYFAAVSRGKRSIAVDLRADGGPALIRELVRAYDVLVEGFRPGVMESIGLAPDDLVREVPGLVVARLSGFGQSGPWRGRPGHDVNYIGLAGVLAAAGRGPSGPSLPPVQLADFGGAQVAAMGIAAGLFERERERAAGRPGGRVLDVSLAEAALVPLAPTVLACTTEDRAPVPDGEPLGGGLPVYGCYECSDGRWLTVGALEPKFQERLSAAAGCQPNRPALAQMFRTQPRDAWVAQLGEACVGPILDPRELAEHPVFSARGAVERVGRSSWVRPPLAEPGDATGELPAIGQHTDAVLREAGLETQVAALRDARVVA